jgi:hypothetical protein
MLAQSATADVCIFGKDWTGSATKMVGNFRENFLDFLNSVARFSFEDF